MLAHEAPVRHGSGLRDDFPETEADTTRRQAVLNGERTALIFGDRRTSFAALDRRASQVANGLIALTTAPQQRIAILAKNSDLFFEVLFGIAKAGHVAMPVNWRLAPREVAAILIDAETDILFVGAEFEHLLPDIAQHGGVPSHVLVIEGGGSRDFEDWRDQQSARDCHVPVSADDTFLQLYTSGTTGHPKGVQLTHGASHRMRALEVGTGGAWTTWSAEDVAVVAMPNFHVGGTNWALQWLARGAACVVLPQVEPRALLDAIDRHGATQLFAVPTVLAMMLADETCATRDFSRLKLIHYGASPIAPPLLVRCLNTFGTGFVQYYGMTETNGVVSVLQPQDHRLDDPELLKSCGRPYPDVGLRIMDPDGVALSEGQIGEICIRTPCLMKGYWKLPELTRASMHGDFYRTGDAGYLDARGYLFLVDRVKDMIVSGAENIYPAEIEKELAAHPAVADAAVIGVPDPHWGEAVKAVVVRASPDLTEVDVVTFLRERIARYKIPKIVEFVDALPRNAAGKVLKRTLRDQHRPGC